MRYSWNMPALKNLNQTGVVVYVYSPKCGACQMRAPSFDAAARGIPGVYRLDASSPERIKELANIGFQLKYYPTVLGISKQGRLVISEAEYTTENIKNFVEALKHT